MGRPRAVVAGGAGFLGSHLCERLLREGYEVLCLDNLLTGAEENLRGLAEMGPLEFRCADVSVPLRIDGTVDLVLNFASAASPPDYLMFPTETLSAGAFGTWHTLELAREKSARYILASSSEVYGDPLVHPQPESYWGNVNPIGPRSVYDEAKRFAEAAAMAYRAKHHVAASVIRIFNTYGPGMRVADGRAVSNFITQALQNQPLTVTGDGEQTRSFCYVDDLVEAVFRLIGTTASGPINLGNPQETTIIELARLVSKLACSESSVTLIPRPADDPRVRQPDISLARSLLGWVPAVALEEGLQRTIPWFKTKLPGCQAYMPLALVNGHLDGRR